MKVVVIGAGGQLGSALVASAPTKHELVALKRSDLDVQDADAIHDVLSRLAPDVIINAAAYTAVDKAESEQATAFAVNEKAVAVMALVASEADARFIHVSTDFVFDGKRSTPYPPDAVPHPLNVYGESKLAGEQRIQAQPNLDWLVIRTSWVYSASGSNFVKTMLRLMAERDELNIVCDQVGTPTSAASLASVIWAAVEKPAFRGIQHWTDAGVASWYDFAVAILEEAKALNLIENDPRITPIRTQEYPAPAKRPAYSVLDKQETLSTLGTRPVHWRENLRNVLQELKR